MFQHGDPALPQCSRITRLSSASASRSASRVWRLAEQPSATREREKRDIRARFDVKPFVASVVNLYDQLLAEAGATKHYTFFGSL